jgi:glycosyltransferase involved in cell wall biosynthesis
MATEINSAYCLVHLSQIESFSLVTAEARTLGVPLIIAKQCTAVIYTAGPSAFQVDGNSKVEVARAISKLTNDPALYSSCVDAITSANEDIFSNEILLNSYLSLYSENIK